MLMAKKKMTTEDLAGMMKREFDQMTERFDGMDRRFDKAEEWQKHTDGRLDGIEMELIDIKKKLETVIDRHEFEILKDRVGRLEKRVALFGKK